MFSLQGAAVDVKLIQQRTVICVTTVLNNYSENTGHVNATEDSKNLLFLLPSAHYILLFVFLAVKIHVRG